MRKLLVVLGLVAVLVPSAAYCQQSKIGSLVDKILGRAKDTASSLEQSAKPKKKEKFVIRLKSGGKITTDNYTVLKHSVRIILPSGAIVISKSEIRDIQTVNADEEGVTVQKTFSRPKEEAVKKQGPFVPAPTPATPATPGYSTDNYGHDRFWWKTRLESWKKKYQKAADKYKEASDDWNRYNGLLQGVSGGGSVSDYQVTQYQDLRGAARVKMDEAQKQMDEAQNMINNVLPDEARKAGAPPGWVR